jgi:hypothetical protein
MRPAVAGITVAGLLSFCINLRPHLRGNMSSDCGHSYLSRSSNQWTRIGDFQWPCSFIVARIFSGCGLSAILLA